MRIPSFISCYLIPGKNRGDISASDILTSIKKIRVLGTGFQVIQTGPETYIQSIARELSVDQSGVIQAGEKHRGMVSIKLIIHLFCFRVLKNPINNNGAVFCFFFLI